MTYRKCAQCGANLDPGEACDCGKILKQKVEAHIGEEIPSDEWEECESYARHKLNFQNKLFNKNNGEDYLVLLAADVYHEQQMSRASFEFYQIIKEAEKLHEKMVMA